MAISRFVDELGTDLNRYQVQEEGGTSYYVKLLRSANVTQVGTSLNAENMNKIVDAINNISFSVSGNTLTIRNQDNVTITFAPKYTKVDVGLGNVDNTSDLNKPISTATKNALDKKADLDGSGKILLSQIPDTGLTADVAKKVMYKEEAKTIEEIFENEIFDEVEQTVECDHEYEITGNTGDEHGLAVKDQQVVIEKIQGQTRRYSENLVEFEDVEETTQNGITYSIKNGVITLNGTLEASFSIPSKILNFSGTKFTMCLYYTGEKDNNLTIIARDNDEPLYSWKFFIAPDVEGKKFIATNSFTVGYHDTAVQLTNVGTTFNNFKLYIQVLEGTHTEETMPEFKPYDNTLVNSKCNLISTNKNLLKKNKFTITISNWFGREDIEEITLPAGTYKLFDTTAQSVNTRLGFFENNIFNEVVSLGYNQTTKTITLNKSTKINRINLDGRQSGTFIKELVLVYGSTAPTEYIPYEQDTFNFNLELGKWDTFDNITNKITRQTSAIATYRTGESLPSGISKGYVANRELSENELTTLVAESEVQLVYKLATPTTEEYVAPNGYQVWEGGLQQQKIEGKYLPYILTKKYSVSIGAQLDANRFIDRGQQEQIDELKNKRFFKHTIKFKVSNSQDKEYELYFVAYSSSSQPFTNNENDIITISDLVYAYSNDFQVLNAKIIDNSIYWHISAAQPNSTMGNVFLYQVDLSSVLEIKDVVTTL